MEKKNAGNLGERFRFGHIGEKMNERGVNLIALARLGCGVNRGAVPASSAISGDGWLSRHAEIA
jgi:hypothetical protein